MGFDLIDMGNSPPWTPTLSCGYLAPKYSVCVHVKLAIHFIHYIQFTSFTYYIILALDHMLYLQYTTLGSRPYMKSTIIYVSLVLRFENEDVSP
jgi:hypothetical protein